MSRSSEILRRREAAVAKGLATRAIVVDRADNAEIWDADGRRLLDLTAGIGVNNTGHRHPRVMQAVAAQAARFAHTCFHVAPFEDYIRLAERLNAATPGAFEKKTMLSTTGAEAVENAVKMARAYTGRSGVIAFSNGFHGRTLMGMALCGKATPYKAGFGAMPPEVFHAPFPSAYHGLSVEYCLNELRRILASSIDPQRVAAFIVEPVQGEGGFNIAPAPFLSGLREVANEIGAVLIGDEIQAGIGRTGKLFAFEHSGVAPDLICMAKGLAGGFPLSAITGRAEIVDAAPVGGIGGTYAGNPLAVAAANAVLDIVEDERLCDRASQIGERLQRGLRDIAAGVGAGVIGDVRGLGAMVAFELVSAEDPATPDAALTRQIIAEAEAHGLIILHCGPHASVIRLLPPLTTPMDQIEESLDIIANAVAAARSLDAAA